jgi:hypothetical protein
MMRFGPTGQPCSSPGQRPGNQIKEGPASPSGAALMMPKTDRVAPLGLESGYSTRSRGFAPGYHRAGPLGR